METPHFTFTAYVIHLSYLYHGKQKGSLDKVLG